MKIVYIHGFGSQVDPESEKYLALSAIGEVVPVAPDYSKSYQANVEIVKSLASDAGLLVGTSMGGYLASRVAADSGLPFIAINPVLLPRRTLSKYLGTHQDYYGSTYTLTPETVNSYPVFAPSKKGLVLLDQDDELIDARETAACLTPHMRVFSFAGGSHRFSHIWESIPIITKFLEELSASADADHKMFSDDHSRIKLPDIHVQRVNTEDENIHCPICHEIVLEQNTDGLRDDPPLPQLCSHVKFVFLDNGYPYDLSAYEYIHDNVTEWLDLLLSLNADQSAEIDRESDVLLSCPLVSYVVIDKPTLPAPFYRVLWGFRK